MAAADAQPDLEHHISHDSLHTGARLLRSTSNLFTGGADGLHAPNASPTANSPPSETTPLSAAPPPRPNLSRQMSHVEMERAGPMSDQEVSQALMQDAQDVVTQNMKYIVCLAIFLVVIVITMITCGILALIAVINHHDKPCDVPLKYYLLVTFLISQVPGYVREALVDPSWSVGAQVTLQLVLAIPGLSVMGWGFWMVTTAKTCPKTNPDLFYPTRNYIFVQAFFITIILSCSLLGALGGRAILRYVNRLKQGPGCAVAVRNDLEKIEPGDKRLLAEDGQVMGCPICMSKLSGSEKHGVIVGTPCNHYFHQECLEEWCQNHMSCPMCRQPIGKPDPDPRTGEV